MEQNGFLSLFLSLCAERVLHALQHVGREAKHEKQHERTGLLACILSHGYTAPALSLDECRVGGWRSGIFVSNYNPRVRERGDRLKLEHIV